MNAAIGAAQKITDAANTDSQNLINQTNADAANKVRAANNELAVAQASFGNLQRSIGNSNKLKAYGSQLDAHSENVARLADAAVRGGLEERLRAAEQMGALHAQVAASGTGGASAAMLHKSLALMAARREQAREDRTSEQTFDMIQQRNGLLSGMVNSLNEGQTFAPVDYNMNVAPLVQSPIRASDFAGSAASQAWTSMLSSPSMQSIFSNLDWGAAPSPKAAQITTNFDAGVSRSVSELLGLGGRSNGFFSTGSGDSMSDYLLS